MKANHKMTPRKSHSAFIIRVLVLIILLTFTSAILSAYYVVLRPINGGVINQGYLWGDEAMIGTRLFTHKGVDFPGPTGTEVLAVTSGTVVALDEHFDNDDHTTLWGNYVIIRHPAKHWDDSVTFFL